MNATNIGLQIRPTVAWLINEFNEGLLAEDS